MGGKIDFSAKSPEVKLIIAGKKSIINNYNDKLFLNNGQMVSFTEFHRTSSNFYLKFDDGTVLWESQLCRPMFAVKGTSVSEKVEFCSVICKEGTVSYFKDIDPIDLWERLKGKTFRVKAESGYKRPESEGCDVSELIQRIKQSVERDEIEKIYRLAHNSVLYSFIEQ